MSAFEWGFALGSIFTAAVLGAAFIGLSLFYRWRYDRKRREGLAVSFSRAKRNGEGY